jgi:hypothetical protein
MGQWGCVGIMYMQNYTHGVLEVETKPLNEFAALKNIC